jgi:uroporphyrinogen decarboxylase
MMQNNWIMKGSTMIQTMTASERVHAALKGEPVDRVPFCFWHHFKPDGSGKRMAELTLDFFHKKFDLDIVKIMPDLAYPHPEETLVDAVQMRFLPRLDLDTPAFQQQLVCIRELRSALESNFPIVLTLFSPLTLAFSFFGGNAAAIRAARLDPAPFEEGLGTITANLRKLMEAAIEAGASGIFFSCMGATHTNFTREEYLRFGHPYDMLALEGAKAGWLNILHAHSDPQPGGDDLYFDLFHNYPTQVISWSDRLTGPSLSEALTQTDKCLMGGLAERGPLTGGNEQAINNEIMAAVTQTKGRHLILANGCSVPDDTPEEWLHIARKLVDNLH